MNAPAAVPQRFEFSFPRLDTAVEVESSPTRVVIRASRDSFSEERKTLFLRELAAEGFIDDAYRWLPPHHPAHPRWVVDVTAFMPGPAAVAQTRRWVLASILSAAAVWLFLMGGLFLATIP